MNTTEHTTTDIRKEKRPGPGSGYRGLCTFQLSTLIYDATVAFCDRFVDRGTRTHDRMVQAARSGRQNIAAAGRVGTDVSKTAVSVINEARNSLDELLLDYEDFLRQRKLRQWAKDDTEAQAVRQAGVKRDRADRAAQTSRDAAAIYAAWLGHEDPTVVANTLICLLHQADYLLVRQAAALERGFISQGGRKQPTAARIAERQAQRHQSDLTHPSDPTDAKAPFCPRCGKPMALRTARTGKNAGRSFWGCTGYPDCRGTVRRGETGLKSP